MVGQPKNKLHLRNPLLLQHNVFKDLIMLQPFLEYGCDSQADCIRSNSMATRTGAVSWVRNEYGPGIFIPNDYDYYDTHINSLGFNWYNNTALVWCSSIEPTPSGREIALSLVEDTTHYFKLGCNAGEPAYFCRSSDGYNYTAEAAPVDIYDGHTFMLAGTASVDNVKVYYNGAELGSVSGEPDSQGDGTGDNILIGDEPDGYGFDQGSIYLAAVWNRPLSAAEIYMLYTWGPNLFMTLEPQYQMPFYGAIAVGPSPFNAAWAYNSNQVL